jgi:methyltransferase OMS1, mitochondrial
VYQKSSENMSGNLRKVGMVLGGGAIYSAAVFISYTAIQRNKKDIEETEQQVKDGNFSFVQDPKRTEQFQRVADTYDEMIGRDEFAMGINLMRRALLYFHAKGTVLEVGAGTGRNLKFYPTTVDRVLLMDSSDQMLMQARRKIREVSYEKPKFACLEGDSSKLEFADNTFDTVVDTFGLCSYDDPNAVLKEMSRVCKPDGRLLLLEHGRSKTWDWITNYLDKHAERHAKNWGCIWNRDIQDLLEQSGLESEAFHTWHFGTTYYLVCKPNKSAAIASSPISPRPLSYRSNLLASLLLYGYDGRHPQEERTKGPPSSSLPPPCSCHR